MESFCLEKALKIKSSHYLTLQSLVLNKTLSTTSLDLLNISRDRIRHLTEGLAPMLENPLSEEASSRPSLVQLEAIVTRERRWTLASFQPPFRYLERVRRSPLSLNVPSPFSHTL